MLRFATSLLHRREHTSSESGITRRPTLPAPPSASDVPYLSTNSSESSTSGSVPTPADETEALHFARASSSVPKASAPAAGGSRWKSVFRANTKKGKGANGFGKEPIEPTIHVHVPTTSYRTGDTEMIDAASVRDRLPALDMYLSPYINHPDDDQGESELSPPIPPFIRSGDSSSRNSLNSPVSSMRSSRSSLVVPPVSPPLPPRTTLYNLIRTIPPTPSRHPLYTPAPSSPVSPTFPRSVSPMDSHFTHPPTLLQHVLRKSLVKKLVDTTYTLTPSEEHALALRPPPHPSSPVELATPLTPAASGWSRDLNRWAERGGFEERNVIWTLDSYTDRYICNTITGGPVAALEFTEGLEALAGFRGTLIDVPVAPFPHTLELFPEEFPDPRSTLPPPLQLLDGNRSSRASPSPSRSSISGSGTPNSASVAKRGVRFAPSVSSTEGDDKESPRTPRVVVRRPGPEDLTHSDPRQSRLRVSAPNRTSIFTTSPPPPPSPAALREEANRQALAREEAQRIRDEALERERRRLRKLQEEVAATRRRRESYRGHDGGSASPRAVTELGVTAFERGEALDGLDIVETLRAGRRDSAPTPRRGATDPGSMSGRASPSGSATRSNMRPTSLTVPTSFHSRQGGSSSSLGHTRRPSVASSAQGTPARPGSLSAQGGDGLTPRRHSASPSETDIRSTRSITSSAGSRAYHQGVSSFPPMPPLSPEYFGGAGHFMSQQQQHQQMMMMQAQPQMVMMMQPVYVMAPPPSPYGGTLRWGSSSSSALPSSSHPSGLLPNSNDHQPSSNRNSKSNPSSSSHPATSSRQIVATAMSPTTPAAPKPSRPAPLSPRQSPRGPLSSVPVAGLPRPTRVRPKSERDLQSSYSRSLLPAPSASP